MKVSIRSTGIVGYDYEWRITDRLGHTVARGFVSTYAQAAATVAARTLQRVR